MCYNQNMKDELAQVKHARSEKDYPELKLEPDEHVVLHLKRSRVGVIALWCMVDFCIIVLSFALIMIANSLKNNETLLVVNDDALGYLRIAIFALYAVVIAGGMVGQSIYDTNEMYITNRRAIQKSRVSLFANSMNIIELRRIEDVSFRQETLFDHLFHIGILRMSTIGDETTYTFRFLDTPRDEVTTISHLVYENKRRGKANGDDE